MGKNIVIFSDGTGQEGGGDHDTNVHKLYKMVEDKTAKQVAFYDSGLGTGWNKITGNLFGMGISRNIIECYEFIVNKYRPADDLFLFGFSRGAYTVRSLGGFVSLAGVLPEYDTRLIKEAYKNYKIKGRENRKEIMDAFRAKHNSLDCPIKFIGVWDTVAALGTPFKPMEMLNPFKHKFHDHVLNPNIKIGYHALSIDDERLTFHPTYWDERRIVEGQQIVQVWFPGVHTDVGGGYSTPQLSDITLDWMVKKAHAQGLRISAGHKITTDAKADGLMHDSRSGLAALFRKKKRELDDRIVKPRIHQSVLERKPDRWNNERKKYDPWILKHEYDVEPY